MIKEKGFIKIPVDFQSIHELKELINNYELVSKLSNALNNYQQAYVDSFFKTPEEVIKYIPESQINNYKIFNRETHIEYLGFFIGDYHWGENKLTTLDMFTKLCANKDYSTKKAFLVNTIKKIIDVCDFKMDKSDSYKDAIIYNKSQKYLVDVKKRKLILKAEYTFTQKSAVGGAWINGRARGYLTGHSIIEYPANGFDEYEFCTKTNKYLGFSRTVQDKPRPWVETRGRY